MVGCYTGGVGSIYSVLLLVSSRVPYDREPARCPHPGVYDQGRSPPTLVGRCPALHHASVGPTILTMPPHPVT